VVFRRHAVDSGSPVAIERLVFSPVLLFDAAVSCILSDQRFRRRRWRPVTRDFVCLREPARGSSASGKREGANIYDDRFGQLERCQWPSSLRKLDW